jgi:hypothetical protein
MAQITLTVTADNTEEMLRHVREATGDTLRLQERAIKPADFHRLHAERDRLVTELSVLKRESGDKYADSLQKSYDDGARDARSEMQQELAYKRSADTLFDMLVFDDVQVTLQPGRAPFHFKPQHVTTIDRCPPIPMHDDSDAGEVLASGTVGIFGKNVITRRQMFLTKVHGWVALPTRTVEDVLAPVPTTD